MRPTCPACKSPRYEFDEHASTWKCRNSMCWHEEHVPRSPLEDTLAAPSRDDVLLERIEGIYKMLEEIKGQLEAVKMKTQKPRAGAS